MTSPPRLVMSSSVKNPDLPYALFHHLVDKPALRDWLQHELDKVTILSRQGLQNRLLREFPSETLMIPTDQYPVFWIWERDTDKREVLLEMFGYEKGNMTSGKLNERLRLVSKALATFDKTETPTQTAFVLQNQVIAQLLKETNGAGGESAETEEKYAPIRLGKVVESKNEQMMHSSKRSTTSSSKPPESLNRDDLDLPPVPVKNNSVRPKHSALTIKTPACQGKTLQGNPCKFWSTLNSIYCTKHQRKAEKERLEAEKKNDSKQAGDGEEDGTSEPIEPHVSEQLVG